jgi:Class II flagellar assembly regulator
MKITGSGPTAGPERRRKIPGRGESSDQAFADHVGARPAGITGLVPATPLAALGGVLAAQEVPDGAAERRRAARHGHGLLDELQALQLGMVEGWVPEAALRRLTGLLDRLRPAVADPDLAGVLEEIELRAAVELAKRARGSA